MVIFNDSKVSSKLVAIHPFDVLSLDLAAVKGEGDTYGAALQLGVKF